VIASSVVGEIAAMTALGTGTPTGAEKWWASIAMALLGLYLVLLPLFRIVSPTGEPLTDRRRIWLYLGAVFAIAIAAIVAAGTL
jgi:hypothetical protein